ncbi:leucine-rich repeat domain-containing protein [Blastopirellula retiformator]|uniref:Leucine Rich repeats (2 copies) n=1 Tax=Blastopirellula retiformator TaxID=2527970 RepID=A0A5C5UT99_9BACT|nr:hypothetical protein [Blastopirellula retiformator]TWT29624.1 Leucine Rich repeats (2 copies) [Blastopirellula retiformator]
MNRELDIIAELRKAEVNFKFSDNSPERVGKVYNVCSAKDQDRIVDLASKLEALKILDVNHSKCITEKSAKSIGQMRQLESLRISFSSLTGTALRHLKWLRRLRLLEAQDVSSLSLGAPYLADIKSLRVLDISGTDFNDAAIEHLQKNVQLEELIANCTKVTGSGFSFFPSECALSDISIRGCPLTRFGLDSIVSLSRLRHLSFSSSEDSSNVDLLGVQWPELETLDFSEISISNEILKELSQIETLTWLRIDDTNLANVDLSVLNRLRNLRDLGLSSTGVSADAINGLVELSNLETLTLADNEIKTHELAPLRTALPNCDIWCG